MFDDLIYDIGLHNGDDTAYYLHKGYHVVAVEANPILVKAAEARFEAEISAGKLVILPLGISDVPGTADFWVNDEKDDWSSFDRTLAARKGMPCRLVVVQCVPLRAILQHFGVPYYLKIDIEGNDIYCLRDLDPADLPKYLSVETHSLEYLLILSRLGYNAFKCISQAHHHKPLRQIIHQSAEIPNYVVNRPTILGQAALRAGKKRPTPGSAASANKRGAEAEWAFQIGSSGPFGDDTPGQWLSMEQVAYKWLPFRLRMLDRLDSDMPVDSWYDFHATKLTPSELKALE